MPEYVHPEVTSMDETDESLVELVIIPADGDEDRLKEILDRESVEYSEDAFGFLTVEVSGSLATELSESDAVRSIGPTDMEISQLSQGN